MKIVRAYLFTGLFFLIASFATCYFGVQYAENQISPDIRSKMTDTDWIGVEWIGYGSLILVLAIVALFTSLILWLRSKFVKNPI